GAGIRFDLDGTGVNTGPLQIKAKDLVIVAVNTPVNVAEGDGFFFVDADGFSVTASVTGPGDLQLTTSSGKITVARPTNTDGGPITITANGFSGGVVVNAPLGDANTGDITLDAGTNDVVFNTALTVQANRTITLIDGNLAQLGPTTVVSTGATLQAAH